MKGIIINPNVDKALEVVFHSANSDAKELTDECFHTCFQTKYGYTSNKKPHPLFTTLYYGRPTNCALLCCFDANGEKHGLSLNLLATLIVNYGSQPNKI